MKQIFIGLGLAAGIIAYSSAQSYYKDGLLMRHIWAALDGTIVGGYSGTLISLINISDTKKYFIYGSIIGAGFALLTMTTCKIIQYFRDGTITDTYLIKEQKYVDHFVMATINQ